MASTSINDYLEHGVSFTHELSGPITCWCLLQREFFMKKVKLLIAHWDSLWLLSTSVANAQEGKVAHGRPHVQMGWRARVYSYRSGWASDSIAILPCTGSTNYEEAAANGADACDLEI